MACIKEGPTGTPDIKDFFLRPAGNNINLGTLRLSTNGAKIKGVRVGHATETLEGKCDTAKGIRFAITLEGALYFLKGTVTPNSSGGETLAGDYFVAAVSAAQSTSLPTPEVGDTGTWGGSTGT